MGFTVRERKLQFTSVSVRDNLIVLYSEQFENNIIFIKIRNVQRYTFIVALINKIEKSDVDYSTFDFTFFVKFR